MGCIGPVALSNLTIRRIDCPAPALPMWQVYDGQVAVDTGQETLTLSMREGHPLALAVREGFWADDCAVWANLTSLWAGGIAFRIQDKNNYFVLLPFSDSVFLCWVRDGNWTVVDVGYVAEGMDWSVSHAWYVRVAGSSLDLTVTVDDEPVTVFDSGTGGNGAGLLAGGPTEGAVGLGTLGFDEPVISSMFAYGYAPEGEDNQVIGYDLFDVSCLTVEPAYDAAGNLVDDGIYQYGYDAWNRLVSVDRKAVSVDDEDYAAVARYQYDGLGRRVSKVVSNSASRDQTEYFYSLRRQSAA